ncbi:MAG: hypothetical protein WKF37_24270 [Bryobacteraceae bacterium]
MVEGDTAGFTAGVLDDQIESLIVEQAHPPSEFIRPLLAGETDLNSGADLSSQGEFSDKIISLGGQCDNIQQVASESASALLQTPSIH